MAAAVPPRRWPEAIRPRPDVMTTRGRAYLTILGLQHLTVGVVALAAPGQFSGPAFAGVTRLLPLTLWAAIFVVIGAQGVAIAVIGRELHARMVLVMSAAVTGAWAAAFLLVWGSGQPISPTMPILWTAAVGKDFVVAGMPLRPPIVELGIRGAD